MLPTAWHSDSIYSNLGVIGQMSEVGQFKQSSNHSVSNDANENWFVYGAILNFSRYITGNGVISLILLLMLVNV